MPELSPCMRLVVRMPQADQDEVVARVDAYTNSGIPAAQAQRMAVADLIAEIDADEKELRALAEAKQPVAVPSLSQTETPEFKRWFGNSKAVRSVNVNTGAPVTSSREPMKLVPLRMYHTTRNEFSVFKPGVRAVNSGTFGAWETERAAVFVTPEHAASQEYGKYAGEFANGARVMPLYVKAESPLDVTAGVSEEDERRLTQAGMSWRFIQNGLGNWDMFDGEAGKEVVDIIRRAGYDAVVFNDQNPETGDSFESWALFDPGQIKSAIGNSGAFDPTNPDIRASLPEEPAPEAGPGFYSALRRELANAKTNASPADYWRNLIKGAVSKGLVKADEVQWSGVEDWLAAQPGKISKTDMLDLLDLRGVRVEETVLGGPREKADTRAMEDALVTRAEQLQAEGNDAHSIDMLIRGESADRIYRQMRNDIGMVPVDFARDIQNWHTALVDSGDERITKYGQYTLPGGTRYREVLLTLPRKERTLAEVERDVAQREGWSLPLTGDQQRAVTLEWKQWTAEDKDYRSNHWDQPNVLAHIRVNDRVDSDGKRVLLVEEIQSDWGQEGKRKGFRGSPDGWLVVLDGDEGVFNTKAEAEAAAREFGGAVRPAVVPEEQSKKVPPAPFVDKTDKWVSLALKRIVKMAVDGGYDKVAFVTGEQSAERYDLSKQVDKVDWVPSTGELFAYKDGRFVLERKGVAEADLTDIIGKEPAAKLTRPEAARPGADGKTTFHRIEGADLKVGGEGMKAFYDRIVPSALKDVLRKVGGGQMGEVTIGSSRLKVQEAPGGDGFVIFDEQTKEFYRGGQSGRPWVDYPRNAKVYLSETSAKKALPQIEGGAAGLQQPGFTITPAMREQVARGLPLFSQVEATTLAASAPPTWDAPAPTRLDSLLYTVQNKQIDLKRVTDAIKESGQQLTDRKDPYLREELYHGRAAYRVQRFAEGEVDPLLKEMRMAQVSVQALDEYLHARHARERNAEMKARNLNRPDNDALSGMSDADAAKILANARPVMRTLAARVDAIIEGTRNLLEVAGLETPEMVDALRNSYQHYVPLHRDELDTAGGQGTGMGYSVRGSTVKRATGSTAAVTNILAHVVAERERVITRAEKNVVGLALYATALQNPNEDFWKPDTPPQKSIIDERVNVFNPGTGQMEANPNYGQVVLRTDPGYKSQPNVLVLRVNGEDRALVFNDRNERAMRMATSLKNLDVEALGAAGEAMAWATRHLAAVNTQYNPVFAVKNMVRDLGAGMANLSTTEIAGKQLQVLAGVAPALRAIYARERGDTPVVGDWGDAYELYQKHGGKTAFREQFVDIDARAKDLMKKLDGSSPADAVRPLTDFVADVNTAVENAVRLSAFRVALANGVSKDRAASLAKNLTVNFNRKGAKTRGIAAFYAFFNAAIQGNARLVETLKGPTGKQIAGGMLTLGFVQALLLASMDPEDEENVPGYIKRTSFVIPNGKNPIYIPLPLGLHVFPNIGRAAAETIFDFRSGKPNATEEAKTRTVELLGTLLDALSPVGGVDNPVLTMLPTPMDWVGALAMNRDWQNRPISRERGPGEESRPGYEMGRDSTSPVYKALAKGIHNTFNPTPYARNPELPGMLSPTPEAIRYIPESLLGGVWRETEKLLDFTRQAATGDEIDQGRIPLLSAFRGDLGSNMAPVSAFWKHVGRADAAERAAKGADRNDAEVPNDPYLDLAGEARAARKALADINKERRELALEGYDANKAQIRALEKEAADVMREFNSAAREALSRR